MQLMMQDFSTIDIDDQPGEDGRLCIVIDDMPDCEIRGTAMHITKQEAAAIVEHLTVAFGLAA